MKIYLIAFSVIVTVLFVMVLRARKNFKKMQKQYNEIVRNELSKDNQV